MSSSPPTPTAPAPTAPAPTGPAPADRTSAGPGAPVGPVVAVLALAGIMGGEDTEVRAGTANVLLESAHFPPATVRRTMRRLGMSTEGGQRWARGVDPAGAEPVCDQAARLMADLAGGTVAFLVQDKAVRVSVDGTSRTLHTFADDVGELLDAEGVTVGARDTVAPAPATGLDDGDEIVVRRGTRVSGPAPGRAPGSRGGRRLNG